VKLRHEIELAGCGGGRGRRTGGDRPAGRPASPPPRSGGGVCRGAYRVRVSARRPCAS